MDFDQLNSNYPKDVPFIRDNGERPDWHRMVYFSDIHQRYIEFHARQVGPNPTEDNPTRVIFMAHGNDGSPYGATATMDHVIESGELPGYASLLFITINGLDNAGEPYACEAYSSCQAWVDKSEEIVGEAHMIGRPECAPLPVESFMTELLPSIGDLVDYWTLGTDDHELDSDLLAPIDQWVVIGHSMGGRLIHRLMCTYHDTRFGGYISLAGSLAPGETSAWPDVKEGIMEITEGGAIDWPYTEPYVLIFGDSDCGTFVCEPGHPNNHYTNSEKEFERLQQETNVVIEELPGLGHNVIELIDNSSTFYPAINLALSAPDVEPEENEAFTAMMAEIATVIDRYIKENTNA